jgi:putative FmdB family regulatory protein
MPLYEFECPDCHHGFEELVRNPEAVKDVTCPSCGARKVRKKLSTVAFSAGGASGQRGPSAPACAPGGT